MNKKKCFSSTTGEEGNVSDINFAVKAQKDFLSDSKLGLFQQSEQQDSSLLKVDECFDFIVRFEGIAEFKTMIERLHRFQQSKRKFFVPNVSIPNFLWVARRSGEIPICIVEALVAYLYKAKVIEFTGIERYFEYKLAYNAPNTPFSELIRLNNTISQIAGHQRHFRGLAYINIDDWVRRTDEKYFHEFLEYIASNDDKILTVFCVHTDNKRDIENIESVLMSFLRFETVRFRFPKAGELVVLIDKYFEQQGFKLTDDAKQLLNDSFEVIVNGKHINGFLSIRHLAEDIMYNLLASNEISAHISADMLAGFSRDSKYAKCIVGTNNGIGFSKE